MKLDDEQRKQRAKFMARRALNESLDEPLSEWIARLMIKFADSEAMEIRND